jgi:HK97 family phage major capsid protein
VQLNAKKLGAQCKFSSEYAEDAIIDVAEDLASEIAYAFAEKEDDTLFNGDGTSTYGGITGVRVKIIDGNHGAGAIDAASGTNTYAEVAQVDLDSIMAPLPQFALPGARWYASQPGKALVFDSLAAAAGGTTMMQMGDRPQPAYLGYPIAISQKMSVSTGDLENVAMLLFGDLSMAATMGDRRGFRVRLLEERYAELDQLAVVAFERFDIVVHDLGDGTTAGPIVALIGN